MLLKRDALRRFTMTDQVRECGGAAPREIGMDKGTERAVFVYTTYPSIVEAEQAGRALVERGLCACVNILPGMISFYRWQGAIERGEEAVMIIKTRASLFEAVRVAVKQMHSYTTPAILVLPIDYVDPDYNAWLMAETQGEGTT
jgi:periplasmic divalent cation tolerance protein